MLFIVLVTAVLSFGNDAPLQSTQSAPTISSLSQIQDLLSQTAVSQNQNSNLPCRSFVSQTYPEAYSQVAEALEVPCASDEGYEIVLLDSEHTEYLKIDQNSSIIIKNAYTNPTIWQINTTKEEIIQLYTGNLTLINFEFRFIILSNGSISSIYPSSQLVFAGNKDNYNNSITIQNCIFQSISGQSSNDICFLNVSYSNITSIMNCIFKGIGQNERFIKSFIFIEYCYEIIIKSSQFQNASIYSVVGAVHIQQYSQNRQILIQDCEFTDINFMYSQGPALSIHSFYGECINITRNIFMNCQTYDGALYLYYYTEQKGSSTLIISNNQFINNLGVYTGALYITSYEQSQIDFSNNNFSQNKNTEDNQIGSDVYIRISQSNDKWTKSNLRKKIWNLFNGSKSDASHNSVFYDADYDFGESVEGSFNLMKFKDYLSAGAIAGIAIGSLVFVSIVAGVIIFLLVLHKKKRQSQYNSLEQMDKFLRARKEKEYI